MLCSVKYFVVKEYLITEKLMQQTVSLYRSAALLSRLVR